MKDLKKVFAILFVITITICLILTGFIVEGKNVPISNVPGFYIVDFFAVVYLFSFYMKKKTLYYVSIVSIYLSYAYTIYRIYFLLASQYNVTLSIGFFIYVLAFIFFNISLKIKDKKEETNTLVDPKEQKKCLICSYLYGIKNKPELANGQCAILYSEDFNNLQIKIANKEKVEELNIELNKIKSITCKPSMTRQTATYDPQEDSMAFAALSAYLFGSFGGLVTEAISHGPSTVTTKYSTIFLTEIVYDLDGEENKIVVQTLKQPTTFFEETKDLYKEIDM